MTDVRTPGGGPRTIRRARRRRLRRDADPAVRVRDLVLQSRDGGAVAASSTSSAPRARGRTGPDADGNPRHLRRSLRRRAVRESGDCRSERRRPIRSSSGPEISPTAALEDDSATAALVEDIPGGRLHGRRQRLRERLRQATSGTATTRPGACSRTGRDRRAGNHDWQTKDLAGYLGYFGTAAAPDGTSWYSYDLGAWHVIVLDSDCSSVGGCGAGSAQGRWLAADLAGVDGPVHARDLAPPALQLRRARQRHRRRRRSGRRSTTPAPTSSSTATTTTTSGSRRRTRTPTRTAPAASASSSSGPAARSCGRSRRPGQQRAPRRRPRTGSSGSSCTRRRTDGRSSRPPATFSDTGTAPCH